MSSHVTRSTRFIRLPLIACLLLWAAPSSAAITFVSGQFAAGGGNDHVVTLPGSTTAGNLITIFACLGTKADTISISGTDLTFTPVFAGNGIDHTGTNLRCQIFWAIANGTGDNSFQVNSVAGGSSTSSNAAEWTGFTGTISVDVSGSNEATSASSGTQTGPSLSVTVNDALVIGGIATDSTTNFGAGTDYNNPGYTTTTQSRFKVYRVITAMGSHAPLITTSSTETWLFLGAAFKASAEDSGCRGSGLLLRVGGC
jgi:hypothetical protein